MTGSPLSPPEDAAPAAGSARIRALLAGLVFLVTAGAFWPAGEFQFLNYDDVVYVTGNQRVHGGLSLEGARWALTATDTAANWHPLTWLAHMLDVELFGLDPRGHHLSSVIWHALAAALFFLALASLLGAPLPALLAALLFALHPLRVEAVAMVADRKDLLAGCAGAATLWAWLAWRRRGGALRAGVALGCYALGLASKPTLLTWFLVLALVDRAPFVPRAGVAPRPPRARAVAVLPFALLALAALAATVRAQSGGGAFSASGGIPLGSRLANAGAALAAYAADTVWPTDLACFYPHPALVPGGPVPGGRVLFGLAFVAAGTALARLARRRLPPVWVGWWWFLIALLPTLGVFQVGLQARADRYTYLPSVGLALAVAVWLDAATRARPVRRALAATLASAAIAGLALAARAQLETWRDTRALMTHAVQVTEHNFLAHTNLAGALESAGRFEESLAHLEAALAARPGVAAVHLRAADLQRRLGRPRESQLHYAAVVEAEPEHLAARLNLAALLTAAAEEAAACEHLQFVFEAPGVSPPERLLAGQALAWILSTTPDEELRDGDRAAAVAEACLGIERNAQVLDALAAARAEQGRYEAAVSLVREALRGSSGQLRETLEQRLACYSDRRPWRRP